MQQIPLAEALARMQAHYETINGFGYTEQARRWAAVFRLPPPPPVLAEASHSATKCDG